MTKSYVDDLVAAYPAITKIWLIGSRANGRARPESDWDYLVFADKDILPALTDDTRFHNEGIDLLIVRPDGLHFRKPWPQPEGHFRKGCLGGSDEGWQWTLISPDRAQYRGCHGVDVENPDSFWADRPPENAILVYPRRA